MQSAGPAGKRGAFLRSFTAWKSWKKRAHLLKRETCTLYLVCRHPCVPWYAKILALVVVGYAVSPIDLIPDFIPVLGYLDDFILIPLGFMLVIRLIPADVVAECRARSEEMVATATQAGKIVAAAVVAVWLLTAAFIMGLILRD
jgi:uncharacterized membrane protein YkvA (DUF1232 family)